MKIIANHAHLMPENSWKEGSAEMLLKHLDFCKIDRAVVFPPFACQFDNNMEKANLWAWEQVRRYPDRLLPAGTLFPLAPNAIDLLHMCDKEGIKLVKIHPSIDLHDVSDPAATEFYAEAEQLDIALDYHTGAHSTRLSLSKPEKFDDIAWNFPDIKLVFEHMGGRTYFEEFLAIINNHQSRRKELNKAPCVFGGLTSNFRNVDDHAMWYISPEKIEEMIRIVGADKLIFGLDFPWNEKERTRKDIDMIMGLNISEEDKSKILGDNLTTLLDIKID
jgi:predicted TIM-barrel fold metal-dependent hydrolase